MFLRFLHIPTCSPVGKYNDALGVTECELCEPGLFQGNTGGFSSCNLCSSGYYTNSTGSTSPILCGTQTYRKNPLNADISYAPNATSCTDCSPGYVSVPSRELCSACSAGFMQVYDTCMQCDTTINFAQPLTAQTSCSLCMFSLPSHTANVAASPYISLQARLAYMRKQAQRFPGACCFCCIELTSDVSVWYRFLSSPRSTPSLCACASFGVQVRPAILRPPPHCARRARLARPTYRSLHLSALHAPSATSRLRQTRQLALLGA